MDARFVARLALGAVLIGGIAAAAPHRMGTPDAGGMCSIDPPIEYSADRPRTIVRESEVIVRAVAVGAVPAPPGSKPRKGARNVVFTVREVLKGEGVPAKLSFYGGLDERDSFQEGPVPYEGFHRWYGGGDCMAMTYRPGGEYLLLLARSPDGGELSPYWQVLAPTNEQIRGADDPWVRWVRRETAAGSRAGG